MKILHVGQSAGYGVTIYIESLVNALRREGIEQLLIGSAYYDTDKWKAMVDKLFIVDMRREIGPEDIKAVRECKRIIKRERPDLVYCHSSKAGIYGRLACAGTGIKVIYNPHGWAFNMKCSWAKRAFYKWAEIGLALLTNKIIVISEYERKTTPHLIPRRKVETIVNGIDVRRGLRLLDEGQVSRRSLGLDEDDFVVGLVARISVQKGQDLLVDIAKRVVREIPHTKFLMVGGKSDDMPIERLIAEAGLEENVVITGEVKDAIRYAKLFDVAVLTSRWEGFGLVLAEYMLAKRPVVAFRVDAVSEVVADQKDGVLIGAGDTAAFAKAIVDLYHNPAQRTELGENGYRKAVKHFDIQRVCEEHLSLFVNLCKQTGGGKM